MRKGLVALAGVLTIAGCGTDYRAESRAVLDYIVGKNCEHSSEVFLKYASNYRIETVPKKFSLFSAGPHQLVATRLANSLSWEEPTPERVKDVCGAGSEYPVMAGYNVYTFTFNNAVLVGEKEEGTSKRYTYVMSYANPKFNNPEYVALDVIFPNDGGLVLRFRKPDDSEVKGIKP